MNDLDQYLLDEFEKQTNRLRDPSSQSKAWQPELQPDGTYQIVPLYSRTGYETIDPHKHLAPEFVAQLAVYSILSCIDAYSLDRSEIVKGGSPAPKRFRFTKIFLDPPDWETDLQAPSAAIYMNPNSEISYDEHGLSASEIEESRDVFAPDSFLIHVTDVTVSLLVHAVFGHKDERSAMSSAMQRVFQRSRYEETSGLTVIVPQYFKQPVRIEITGAQIGGEPAEKMWDAMLRLTVEVPMVELVRVPRMLRPRMSTEASQG